MPVVLRMWPKYCISLEKKLHLLFFVEMFVDLSFLNTMQMCERCSLWGFAKYDNVIQVHYGEGKILEYTSHKFLEIGWHLHESKWYLYIFISSEGWIKCCLGYRWFVQGNVMITCAKIQCGEVCGSVQFRKYVFDFWHGPCKFSSYLV